MTRSDPAYCHMLLEVLAGALSPGRARKVPQTDTEARMAALQREVKTIATSVDAKIIGGSYPREWEDAEGCMWIEHGDFTPGDAERLAAILDEGMGLIEKRGTEADIRWLAALRLLTGHP